MNLILFLIAFVLVAAFTPFGFVFTIIKSIILWNYPILNEYFFKLAVSLDQFGNVAIGGFFNLILIRTKSNDKFGNPDETISSVLGKNKIKGNLIYLGLRLDALLDGLDKNHSIKSIEK